MKWYALFYSLIDWPPLFPFINWSLHPLSQIPAFSPLKDGREQHSPGNFWSDPAFNVVLIEARVGILTIADDQQAVFPPYCQRHHPPGGAGPAIYSLPRKQNIPPKEPSKSTLPKKLLQWLLFSVYVIKKWNTLNMEMEMYWWSAARCLYPPGTSLGRACNLQLYQETNEINKPMNHWMIDEFHYCCLPSGRDTTHHPPGGASGPVIYNLIRKVPFLVNSIIDKVPPQ